MVDNVTIALKKPLEGHEGPIRKVVLRPPSFDEYLRIGDPYEIGESKGGVRFSVQNPDAIREYIECCVIEPMETDLLKQGGAKLAQQLKYVILDFFRDGDEADAASKTSPTN